MNIQKLYDSLQLEITHKQHLKSLRYIVNNTVPPDLIYLANESLTRLVEQYNTQIKIKGLPENCMVNPTDSTKTIRKKCKKAFKHGEFYHPMHYVYAVSNSPLASGLGEENNPYDSPDYALGAFTGAFTKVPMIKKPLTLKWVDDESGVKRDEDDLAEEKSTERVRKYYKRHPDKVREYLKKTQDDRVARNRDRRKAIKKHGKAKMKNHDVHHPNGPHNGGARLVKKDHGRDPKNENYVYLDEVLMGNVPNEGWTLINEGGAAGHMAHPYEDDSLTFTDVKEMIHRGLVGQLDQEEPVTEKLDGQNIAFTIKDGQIRFARNKGQVKNRAQNALDVAGIRNMFAGRGAIERAFTGAAEDLEAAVAKLSPEQQQAMFANGGKFMNVEVIFPDTKNVIPYDKAVLVFHGTIAYDEAGEETGRNQSDGKALASTLTAVNADKQKTFGISGPRTIAFSDAETSENKRKMQQYIRRIQRMQDEFGLDDNSTIEDYKRAWWGREVDNMGIDWTPEEREGLIERWATGSKKFGVKNIEDKEKAKLFRQYEKEELVNAQKRANQQLERTFLQVGTAAMRRVTNALAANNPKAAAQLKQEVLDTIRELQNTDDVNKLAKLQQQVERLDTLGVDNIVPSEGVVFMFKGKPYKFTGTFAPVNQILGTLKFDKGKAELVEPPKEQPKKEEPTPSEPTTPPRTVAIFAGRFQPFHAGHYSVYQSLVDKFGKDNVYIVSSNRTDATTSPFEFKQKQEIMTRLFDIPEDRVVQVKNPYAPEEVLSTLPANTTYVTAVSQKDADRLSKGGRYFRPYEDGKSTEGFADRGYFIVAPEMQLNVNGKNISGTQLRAVMGNPNITDRAKKEIFTQAYGQFDQKIFDMVVKKTTESEEALKLTQQYGKTPEKKPRAKKIADKKPSKDVTAGMTPQQKKRAQSVLRQRIVNPETQRKIFVATALGYEKNNKARQEAERLLQQALRSTKTEEVITESLNKDTLKTYIYVREYTDQEYNREVDEYFENEVTFQTFPKLADTPEELIEKIKNAPTVVLTKDELEGMTNSEVGDVLSSKTPKTVLQQIAKGHGRDVAGIARDIKNKQKFAMPIVIKHPMGYYLMAGNTRLSVLASIGHTMPVKVLEYPEAPQGLGSAKGAATADKKVHKKARQSLFNKILQMRITNPETGNDIKIDTAMDYKKTHPAHKLALSIIRQKMKDVSTRAGVPKNKQN